MKHGHRIIQRYSLIKNVLKSSREYFHLKSGEAIKQVTEGYISISKYQEFGELKGCHAKDL